MTDTEGLVLPEDVPKHRFMRYVRAPHGEHQPLYPLIPATRPLRVGLDVSTLGPEPPDVADFVSVLRRRPEVEPALLVFGEDRDEDLTELWSRRIDCEVVHVVDYRSFGELEKVADASQVWVSTYTAGEKIYGGWCPFFGVYADLDALQSAESDLSDEDRYRAAALAAVALKLGLDVVVTEAATAGRADVADNDIAAMITPADLLPIFGHYLRMTGNLSLRYNRQGVIVHDDLRAGSVSGMYHVGVESHVPLFRYLMVAAGVGGHADVVSDLGSIAARAQRALRALDELLAALSTHNGPHTPTVDTTERVSEAFDRELLYLTAVFDTFGRLFRRLHDGRAPRRNEPKTLYSPALVTSHIVEKYADDGIVGRIVEHRSYAHITATLRNYIHEAVLPTGPVPSRGYGSATTIAVNLDLLADVELTQRQADRLGVWKAIIAILSAEPTTVGDLATFAVTLMTTALDYVNTVIERSCSTTQPTLPRTLTPCSDAHHKTSR
ncbi:hypothetical protein [Nocardia sp. NPDC059691]|uniref:hypothetical protein n=1 Tax=Nocardia sp. NPDC059691 TaxID=3346908 RepID=UPI00367F111B